MDVFDLRRNLVDSYANYIRSFIQIRGPADRREGQGRAQLRAALARAAHPAQPVVRAGPNHRPTGRRGSAPPDLPRLFRIRKTRLRHLRPAAAAASPPGRGRSALPARGVNYVLTTGTGSGKSLAYIIPIVDHVLRKGSGGGVSAIVVYPMNALANSQYGELEKFLRRGLPRGREPRSIRHVHRPRGSRTRSKQIVANPPGHPAHELRDARADPDPARRAQSHSSRPRACDSSCSTSCTPTAAARAATSPCWCDGSATGSRPTSSSASEHPRPWRARERSMSSESRSPASRRTCSAPRFVPRM